MAIISTGNGSDSVTGTSSSDVISSGNGNDTVDAGAGNDTVDGGNGNDVLNGGSGDDTVLGGNGEDIFIHNVSDNIDVNNSTFDFYDGGRGSDTLKFIVTQQQANDLAAAIAAFNASNKSTLFDFQLYVPYLDLKVIRIENIILEVSGGSNNAPVGVNASFSVVEGAALVTGQLNASDPDAGDVLTYTTSAVVAGFVLNPNGSYSFDANDPAYNHLAAGVPMVITIPFTVSDGNGGVDSSKALTINLTGTNDGPAAVNASISISEGAVATGQLNASDPDAGDVLTYTTGAVVAGFVLNPNGSYSFDANDPAYNHLAVGDPMTITIPFTVNDGNGGVDSSKALTINLTGTNDGPAAVNASFSVVEGAALVTGQLNASDPDAGDVLTYTTGAVVAGFVLNPNGSYSFDANDPAYNHLAAGVPMTITIPFTVSDGNGGVDSSKALTINLIGTNDGPAAVNASFSINEGSMVTGQLNASDPDAGDVLTYTTSAVVAGFVLNANGSYSFDANDPAYNNLAAGVPMIITIPFTVSDGNGGVDSSKVLTINLTGTNDGPVAFVDMGNVKEDDILSAAGNVLTNDTDSETDPLSVTKVTFNSVDHIVAPAGMVSIVGDYGILELHSDGTYAYLLDNAAHQNLAQGEMHDEVFTYMIADGNGGTSSSTLTITVEGKNDAPAAFVDMGNVKEDDILSAAGNVLTNDTDIDADTLAVTKVTFNSVDHIVAPAGMVSIVGAYGTLELYSDGSYSYSLDNAAHQNLAQGVMHDEVFTYMIADGNGGTSSSTLTITVEGKNDAPTAITLSNMTADENIIGLTIGTINVTDLDLGDSHTFTLSDSRFIVEGNQLKLKDYVALDFEQESSINLTITARDNFGAKVAGAFTINVTDDAQAYDIPFFSSNPDSLNVIFVDWHGGDFYRTDTDTTYTLTPFDSNADPSSLSAAEKTTILDAMKAVAADYAMFDVNITTLAPQTLPSEYDDETVIIGNGYLGGAGGLGYVNRFGNSGTNAAITINGSGTSNYLWQVISHEIGHTMGLSHQSIGVYEYSFGLGDWVPTMGSGSASNTWWSGPSFGYIDERIQNDLEAITEKLGKVADDHGDDFATATPLNASLLTSKGVINFMSTSQSMGEHDLFAFSTKLGNATINVQNDLNSPSLAFKVSLYDENGTLVASLTPDSLTNYDNSVTGQPSNIVQLNTTFNDVTLTLSGLSAGIYYLDVTNNGVYGRLGNYTVSGSAVSSVEHVLDVTNTVYIGDQIHDSVSLPVTNKDVIVGNDTDNFIFGDDLVMSVSNQSDFLASSSHYTWLLSNMDLWQAPDLNGVKDILSGGAGDDFIYGQGGDDILIHAGGADVFNGGAGSDTVSYIQVMSSVMVDLSNHMNNSLNVLWDTYISIENIIGSNFSDTLTGDENSNVLSGYEGSDTLIGGNGNDILIGGPTSNQYTSLVTGVGPTASSLVESSNPNNLLSNAQVIDRLSFGYLPGTVPNPVNFDPIDFRGYPDIDYVGVSIFGANFDSLDVDFYAITLKSDETLFADVDLAVFPGSADSDLALYNAAGIRIQGGSGLFLTDVGDIETSSGNLVYRAWQDGTYYLSVTRNLTPNLTNPPEASNPGGSPYQLNLQIANIPAIAEPNPDNDVLIGGNGNDQLFGQGGNDTLDGGADDDDLDGGADVDTASYAGSTAGVTVSLLLGTGTGGDAAGDTLINIENLTGSSFADTLTGDANNNVLTGGVGGDTLIGGDGHDTLDGGLESDTLNGGAGTDTASYAGSTAGLTVDLTVVGPQVSVGDASGDVLIDIENLTGSSFADTLTGNTGTNVLTGGDGDDILIGGGFGDTLNGGNGTDTASYTGSTAVTIVLGVSAVGGDADGDVLIGIENLTGSSFADTLTGDGLSNVLIGGGGADTLDGGAGTDTASYAGSTAVTVSLLSGTGTGGDADGDTLSLIENLTGSSFADTLTGNTGTNVLIGGGGADTLDGGNGTDTASYAGSTAVTVSLLSGTGTGGDADGDTLINIENLTGSSFADTLTGNTGNNVITGSDGDDILIGGGGADTLNGGNGTDTASYTGSTAVTIVLGVSAVGGDAAGDTLINIENLTGSSFADTLTGNTRSNVLNGGGGADTIDGGDGTDTASYVGSAAGVTVSLLSGTGTGGDADGDSLSNIENLTGSSFADILTGDGDTNILTGGDGDDILIGGSGIDTLDGGDGIDTASYVGSASGVTVSLLSGTGAGDTLSLIENLTGSSFSDTLTGDANNNVLNGSGGNDTLDGRLGNDTLTGAAGNDTFVFNMEQDGLNLGIIGNDADTVVDYIFTATSTEVLRFTGVFDVNGVGGINEADLDAGVTSFNTLSNVGGTTAFDTIVSFAGGGTLTFFDITFTSFVTLESTNPAFNNNVVVV